MKEITGEWIKKAEGDFKVARREFRHRYGVDDIACFHAQQCVEKYLKAILAERGSRIPRTHDLEKLLKLCETSVPALKKHSGSLAALSQFSIATRYPLFNATNNDSKTSTTTTRKIRQIIRKHFRIS